MEKGQRESHKSNSTVNIKQDSAPDAAYAARYKEGNLQRQTCSKNN